MFNITSNVLGALNTIANIGTEKQLKSQNNPNKEMQLAQQEAQASTMMELTDVPVQMYQNKYDELVRSSGYLENKWKKNPSKANFNKFKEAQAKSLEAQVELNQRLERLNSNRARVSKYMEYFKGGSQ